MKGSRQRVRQVLAHEKPDRPALFDLLPNDAVLQYFNNAIPVEIGDDKSAIHAITAATDATRFTYFSPMEVKTAQLEDGREQKYDRWSIWTSHKSFSSSEEYRTIKIQEMKRLRKTLEQSIETQDIEGYKDHRRLYDKFGEDYCFLLYVGSPGFMFMYEEVGIEAFSYYLFDCEDIIIEQLELYTEFACQYALNLPPDDPFDAVFIGEDMAFNTGTLVNPDWLEQHYFPRLKRVIDVFHAKGKKVMFHSDGNLNKVMDGLVAAGIDILNPIEIAAGMDLADLHNRYPKLIFAGGIDVTELLPFGSPSEVKDAVVKAIEDTEGQILVGSSTEVFNAVPLENYLAVREAALNYKL